MPRFSAAATVAMKKICAVLLVLILLGLFCACDVATDKEKEITAYPVTVANVTVTAAPKKVACLSPSLTEIVFEQGYGDTVILRTEDTSYPEEAAKLPAVGRTGHIDTAAIIEANPDAVLTQQALSLRETEALAAAKIQVIVLPMAKDLEELKTLYETIGLLYRGAIDGKETGAKQYAVLQKRIDAIKQKLDGKTTSYLYIVNPSGLIATGDTFENSVLSIFGENTAADGTGYTADIKEIEAKSPEVIFIAEPYGLPHLTANGSYKNFRAVKEKKVYSVDSTLFGIQSGRLGDLLETLAAQIYPDLFPEEEELSSEATSNVSSASVSSQK